MRSSLLLLTALILVVGLSGCAFTTMQTSRQLDKGETVVSGAIDWPGAFVIIPRMSGQVQYGLGFGDIGAHVGTALFVANAGATARVYPANWLSASVEADVMMLTIDEAFFGSSSSGSGVLTISPRLLTSTVKEDLFYGGLQSNLLFGFGQNIDGLEFGVALIGLVGGLEYIVSNQLALQLELSVSPFYISPDGAGSTLLEEGVPIAQLGLGVNWSFGREGTAPPTGTTPTPRVSPPPQDPRGESERREPSREDEPPPAPMPVYDDDGVPLY
ncbi:MAG: hypothetical protein ACNA8W_17750 [Bradymonadaceae bacterium]